MEETYEEYEKYGADFDETISDEEDNIQPDKPKNRGMLLIIFQISICAAAILAAVVIKFIGGSVYAAVGTWFFEQYNNSVFTGNGEGLLPFTDNVTIKETSLINEETAQIGDTDYIEQIKKSFVQPLDKIEITSPFGKRELDGKETNHKGIDLAAKSGTAIYAVMDGEVTIAQEDSTYGNYIVIMHENGEKTLYAHCSKLLVKKGETVKSGTKIALSGHSGQAEGDHLHFEIIIDGKNVDPSVFLKDEDSDADKN